MPAFWFDSSWPKTLQRVPHPLCAENLAVKLLWGFSKLIWRETTLLLFFFFFFCSQVGFPLVQLTAGPHSSCVWRCEESGGSVWAGMEGRAGWLLLRAAHRSVTSNKTLWASPHRCGSRLCLWPWWAQPQHHRMVWGGKDLKDHLVPNPAMGRDTSHQTGLLQALCNPALTLQPCCGFLSFHAVKSSEGQFPGGYQPPDLVTKNTAREEMRKWQVRFVLA